MDVLVLLEKIEGTAVCPMTAIDSVEMSHVDIIRNTMFKIIRTIQND